METLQSMFHLTNTCRIRIRLELS